MLTAVRGITNQRPRPKINHEMKMLDRKLANEYRRVVGHSSMTSMVHVRPWMVSRSAS
jgi:hypothetical protein